MSTSPGTRPAADNALPAAGLIAGLVGVTRNGLGLLLSRLELVALELSEARKHLFQLLGVLALAMLALWFALAYGTLLVVYLAWARLGWAILGVMAVGFAALALGLLWYARGLIRQGKLSLPATMSELKADRDMLL
jgi:uncharacterized membrane protein YqjE